MSAEIYTGIILFKDGDGSSCDRKRRHLGLLSLYQTEEESYHLCEILRPFRTESRQALPSKTADGSVAHKKGGDFEFLSGFSSKLKEFPRAMGWVCSGGKKGKRGESNFYEKQRSRYSKGQKGRKYDFGKSKVQPQRCDSWKLQNCFPRSHPIICSSYLPHHLASI
ncbi:hypothetical protein POTOM_009346 [Populus tomentosa]|uniref:Uncharacterized protein n=1 Tax=Populus tomentosa TaxID=118781 RepID=A0A8X8DA51_POPTO|nr:hypothetical protein POTOM_009346 [Populus tomentosa]